MGLSATLSPCTNQQTNAKHAESERGCFFAFSASLRLGVDIGFLFPRFVRIGVPAPPITPLDGIQSQAGDLHQPSPDQHFIKEMSL
jgi:hypothetical protein